MSTSAEPVTTERLDHLQAMLLIRHQDYIATAEGDFPAETLKTARTAWKAALADYSTAVTAYLSPIEAAEEWERAGKHAALIEAAQLPDQCTGTNRGWATRWDKTRRPWLRWPVCPGCDATPADLNTRKPAWRDGRFTSYVPRHSRVAH